MADSSTTEQTVQINDMEMYYEIRGDGEPLILLHGGTGFGGNWRLIFPESPPGYRLITPDLRGHGRSTNPAGQFTFQQCALDVFALLDHLGIHQVKAIGLSLGAKTLLHLATQQPERLKAMVMVSATPYFPEQARQVMRQITIDNHSDQEWEMMRQWHKHGDDQIRALWKMARDFQHTYDDLNFTPPLLATITASTLIVHGDRDPLYPPRLALEMYAAIPRSYLWVVPNGDHGPIFGDKTGPFVRTALDFLGGAWDK